MSAATATMNPKSAVFRVPVFGQLFRDAVFGKEDAKYYFMLNLVMVFAWTIFTFGYPALIIYALTGTFCAMVFLITITSQDLIEEYFKRRAKKKTVEKKVSA